jgi:hypothetical protein
MNEFHPFVVGAQQCAALFRLGRDVEAGLVMIEVMEGLPPSFIQEAQATELLGRMLECQEAQNWLALADYLECELVQLMADVLSI